MKAYFFPGLGADATLGSYHRLDILEPHWIKWPSKIQPQWDAFLSDLFQENEIEEGALLIGISFGGLVAIQTAKKKRPNAIILIGSLTSSKAVSPIFRPFHGLVNVLPTFLFNLNWVPPRVIGFFFGISRTAHLAHFFRMVRGYTPAQTKGLIKLALSAPPVELNAPMFAIHGEKDRILPARTREPGHLVKGAGHLVSMTHSDEVNRAILDWIKDQKWARGLN